MVGDGAEREAQLAAESVEDLGVQLLREQGETHPTSGGRRHVDLVERPIVGAAR